MLRRRLNRREALGLGAAALAGGALRPRSALAAGTSLFELPIEDGGAHVAGWRAAAGLGAPRRFDLIGLRWARGGHLDAQVRARRRGGGWTPWLTLHASGDHAPRGAPARAGAGRRGSPPPPPAPPPPTAPARPPGPSPPTPAPPTSSSCACAA